jgi:hypothetical protein
MSWDLIKALWELIQTLSIYVVLAAWGVTGIAVAVAIVCWVIDFIRKELGR